MTTRRERVIVEAVDSYSAEVLRMAGATALFRREADQSNRSIGPMRSGLRGLDSDARKAGSSIDQLSGRLGLAVRAAGAFGPALTPLTTSLTPVLAGATTQVGFLIAALGTSVLAFQGVGDALTAIEDARLDPTVENLEEARQAMSLLAPQTQTFVRELSALRPQLTGLRDAAAGGIFPGLTESLDDVESLLPRMSGILERIGSATGNLIADGAEALAGPEWVQFFDFIEREAEPTLTTLGRTIGNLTRGVAELWMRMDPLSDDFTSGLLNASEDFARWADELGSTQGYREFLDYVRDTTPQVLDTLGSLGDAVLQIGEAAAPLGGPVLRILEDFLDVIARIADSPLGTPLLAIAAIASQVSLLRRAMTGLQGVMARPIGAGTVGGMLAGGTAAGRSPLRTMIADYRTLQSVENSAAGRAQATASAVVAQAQARDRLSASIRGNAAAAAKGGAAVAGLAFATSGAAESAGLTNTASLALLGTLAGPWGAGLGAAGGAVLDLKGSTDALSASIKGIYAAIDAGDLDGLNSAMAETQRQMNDLLTSDATSAKDSALLTLLGGQVGLVGSTAQGTIDALGDAWGRLSGKADEGARALRAGAEAQQTLASYQEAAASDRRYLSMLGAETAALQAKRNALRANQSALLAAFDAETAYRQALVAAREQARSNTAGIRGSTQAALGNRSALSQLAAAWNNQSASVRNNEARHRSARAAFVDTAVQMGVNRGEAQRLAREYLRMPKSVETRVIAKDEASARLAMIRNAIDQIRDKEVTITTNYRITRSGSVANTPGYGPQRNSADGSTVPKTGLPYADRHHYLLADGEEVVSNRYGQADRWRWLLKAINANRLADGGTARRADAIRAGVAVSPRFNQAVTVPAPQISLAGLTLRADVDGLGEVMFRVADDRIGAHRAGAAARSAAVYSGVSDD